MDFGRLNKVVVLSKQGCPYCQSVRDMLDSLVKDKILQSSQITIVDVSEASPRNMQMFKRSFATVPQIFINGQHIIGGASNFKRIYESGELLDLLD
jgi:glutaredoxin